jgi:hypothetical protein
MTERIRYAVPAHRTRHAAGHEDPHQEGSG